MKRRGPRDNRPKKQSRKQRTERKVRRSAEDKAICVRKRDRALEIFISYHEMIAVSGGLF